MNRGLTLGRAALDEDGPGLRVADEAFDGLQVVAVGQCRLEGRRLDGVLLQADGHGAAQVLEEVVDVGQCHLARRRVHGARSSLRSLRHRFRPAESPERAPSFVNTQLVSFHRVIVDSFRP